MNDQYSSGASNAAGIAALLIGALVVLAITIGILAIIAYFVSENYKAIPQQYRKMEPGKVWLMLIPMFFCVNDSEAAVKTAMRRTPAAS